MQSLLFLAQEGPPATNGNPSAQKLFWLMGAFAGSLFLLVIAIQIARKWAFQKDEKEDSAPAGFGLGDLRDMRDQGLISEEEYLLAKEKIAATSKKIFLADKKKPTKLGVDTPPPELQPKDVPSETTEPPPAPQS